MSKEWKCPKCGIGAMRQQGLMSCNWRCEVCGNYIYVPRPQMEKADLSDARKKASNTGSRSAKEISRSAMDAAKAANKFGEERRYHARLAAKSKEKADILADYVKRRDAISKKYKNDSKRCDAELAKNRQERDEALQKHEKKWSKKGGGSIFAYFVIVVIFAFILRYLGIL